jgi:oligopeptide transport system substrate-binding protein
LRTIYDDESNQYHDQLVEKLPKKYSYQFHFNYDKRNSDGSKDENWNKAVANEAFRQSMYYGLDLTSYWARTNYINPLHCENVTYTMKGLLYTSDGTDYTELVTNKLGLAESDGTTSRRYDSSKAAEYKEQAMTELAAQGVTFPVEIDYYIISGSQVQQDTATVLQQIFSECLGDDYVKLNIKTYVSSLTQEVVAPRLQSFVINGWGADYGDPQNYLGQETYGEDTAYYANNYSNINDATDETLIATYKEFTELVNKANAITDDLDARYEAYAEAEAYMLSHALSIPAQLEVSWQLTKVNDYTKSNAMYGILNYKYKNWDTSKDAYTTEQYEQFAEEASE